MSLVKGKLIPPSTQHIHTQDHTPQPSFPLFQSVLSSLSLSHHPPLIPFFYLSSSSRFLFTDFLWYFFLLWRNWQCVTALTRHSLLHLKLHNICLPCCTNTILQKYMLLYIIAFPGSPGTGIMWNPLCCFSHPHRFIVFFLGDEKYHLWLIMFFFL